MPGVIARLRAGVQVALDAGVPEAQIIVDPGVGFAKGPEQNLEVIRRLGALKALGRPILLGTSRKGFIGQALGGLPAGERVEGTAATLAIGIANGADMVRVHDVRAMVRVARMTDALVRGTPAV
jgi:dihydropteroate synthase